MPRKQSQRKPYRVEGTRWYKWIADCPDFCLSGVAPALHWLRKHNFRSLREAWKACRVWHWMDNLLQALFLGHVPEDEQRRCPRTRKYVLTARAKKLRKARYPGFVSLTHAERLDILRSVWPTPPACPPRKRS